MDMRTTTRTVRFSRPFMLAGVDDVQPAGDYIIETHEELLPAASVSAYRRISTLMRLPPRPGSNERVRVIDLDPLELSRLLASDAAPATAPSSPLPGTGTAAPRARPAAAPARMTKWRSWLAVNANELTWIALVGGGVLFTALLADG